MSKTFHIKVDKSGYAIELETDKPQFKTLEFLMYRVARHFIQKGKTEELKSINKIIEAMLI